MIYTSKADYTSKIIEPALGEFIADHDIDAIADDMLIWHDEITSSGMINLDKSGLIENPTQDFWEIVESHAL